MGSVLVHRHFCSFSRVGGSGGRRRSVARMAASDGGSDAISGRGVENSAADAIVQYLVLRRDLIESSSVGRVFAQGCNAAVAAIWENKDDPFTSLYCNPPNLDSMRKVTLEVKGEVQMVNLSVKLKEAGIAHKLWIDQPEKLPTCLSTKPYPKSIVSSFFKKLKLCSSIVPRTEGIMDSFSNVNGCTKMDKVVQYVAVRRDLIDSWPLGSNVTQACHASVAVLWSHKDDPYTVVYCSPSNMDSMSKVVFEVKDEEELVMLSKHLKDNNIAHKLWIEQPENIPTSIATMPYPEYQLSSFLQKLQPLQARQR